MNSIKSLLYISLLLVGSCKQVAQNEQTFTADAMLIRLSVIEIDPTYLEEYTAILKEESEASVRLEPGVISIFPMFQKDQPTAIKILEIYSDQEAYLNHLQTSHFKHYKTETLHMVKSLKLIDMQAMDEESMPEIFEKLTKLSTN